MSLLNINQIKKALELMKANGKSESQMSAFINDAKPFLTTTSEPTPKINTKIQPSEAVLSGEVNYIPGQIKSANNYDYKYNLDKDGNGIYYTRKKGEEDFVKAVKDSTAEYAIASEFGHSNFDKEAYFKEQEDIRNKTKNPFIGPLLPPEDDLINENKYGVLEEDEGGTLPFFQGLKNIASNQWTAIKGQWEATKAGFTQFLFSNPELEAQAGPVADMYIANQFKKVQANQLEVKDTGLGIVGGFKEASVKDAVLGGVNAIASVFTTVAPAMLTRGISLGPQIIAPMYAEYNISKAETLYPDDPDAIDKLVQNNEIEVATPIVLGGLAVGLEKIGIKGIGKYIGAKSFTAKGVAKLTSTAGGTGGKEGLTEWGQGIIEQINSNLSKGDDKEEAIKKSWQWAKSEDALETFAQGFFGGTSFAAGGRTINRALRNDNVSITDFNSKIDNLAELNNARNNATNQQVKDEINIEIKEAENDFKNFIKEKRKLNKFLTTDQKTSLLGIMKNKDNLTTKLDNLKKQLAENKITAKDFGYASRSINNQNKKLNTQIEDIKLKATEVAAQKATEVVEKQVQDLSKLGIKAKVTQMTSSEIQDDINQTESDNDAFKASKEFGFIRTNKDGSFDIVVNKDKPAVGTASHEFLHLVLNKTIKNNAEVQNNLGNALIDHIKTVKGDKSPLGRRLSAYGKLRRNEQGEVEFIKEKNFGEEVITLTSEMTQDGSLKFNESLFTKIGDVIRRFLQEAGLKDVKFDTGKDVFNFIKDYNNSIKTGKLSKLVSKVAVEGVDGKLITKQTDGETITKFSKESLSNDIQDIYNDKGVDGAYEIIEAYRGVTSKLVNKRREAPGFDAELLRDEMESGKRGLLDLIMEYDPTRGAKLSTFIFDKYPLRAIEASKRVLGENFAQDITEARGIAAEQVVEEEVATTEVKQIVLSDRLNINDKVNSIVDKINLSTIKEETFKTLKPQTTEVVGELMGIKPKKITTNANLTKPELAKAQMFINKNADLLLNMLPEGHTSEGTATGVQKTLLDAFYTKSERRAKTGPGLQVQFKKPNIKRSEFLELFGIIDGKPTRDDRNTSARVIALGKQLDNMLTNQAIRKRLLANPTEDNVKNSLRLADGKSNIMFSRDNSVKDPDAPFLKDYFENKTEDQALQILGNFATMKDSEFKVLFPEDFKNITRYVEDTAQHVADGSREAEQFTKSFKTFDFGDKKLNTHLSEGFWTLSDAKFKTDKKANKWFESNAHNLASQIFLGSKAKQADMNFVMGFFAGHYNIVGSDAAKVGSKLKKGIITNMSKKGKSVLDNNILNEWKNFDYEALTSSYASKFKTGLKNVYKANTKQEQLELADSYFNGKDSKTQVKFYDLWNRTLEQWLHSSDVGSAEFNSKADYIMKLKKANSAIGTTGERVLAPGGYIYLPGTAEVGKTKFEHLKSSSQQSKESASLIIGNNWAKTGKDKLKDYKGIYGTLHLFNMVDDATGKVNESNIFRLAKNLDAAKNIHKIGDLSTTLYDEIKLKLGKDKINALERAQIGFTTTKAVSKGRLTPKETKGISVLDFDDTLATTKSKIKFTKPDGTTGTLNAEQYAKDYQGLLAQGYKFDFSEFSKVVQGKTAPLFNKAMKLKGKFGTKDMFILTARPPDSAPAIQEFLKSQGLNIPLENITALGNSTSDAKALWMAGKVGEGYNDFYFADDALQNVQAVDNVLEQFDVKRKVQQAKIKFSKDASKKFNNILEETFQVEAFKKFSPAKGRLRGQTKGTFDIFIPPSAEDFKGLLYGLAGKGKKGEDHLKFFNNSLLKPFSRGSQEIDLARVTIAGDYKGLNKDFKNIKKKLSDNVAGTKYTLDNAMRVYLWDKAGFETPGLTKTDKSKLIKSIQQDSDNLAYANGLSTISKTNEGWIEPGDYWITETIASDLDGIINKVNRNDALAEFKENREFIFGKWDGQKLVGPNMNKLEAIKGLKYREAVEDIVWRMENGTNRNFGGNRLTNAWANWTNNSVGAIMFFNQRSALLQLTSSVNYVNWADNNPINAAKAFANQKQYWKDFAYLWNSPTLLARRQGLRGNIETSEIALAADKGGVKGVMAYMMKLGFTPTQMADSFAISSGGAPMYRNRINTYIKKGMSKSEAETQAFDDFNGLTQEHQQSSRADKISMQQAGPLGRLILAFQNTPMQYARITKRSLQDIINGRGDMKTNISKVVYYTAIQNLVFQGLQSAIFRFAFDDDDEEKQKKQVRIANGTVDTMLRGMGVGGAVVATAKNAIIKFIQQENKKTFDESAVVMEALNLSPPIGSKARKIVSSMKTLEYQRDEIKFMPKLDIDNPVWQSIGNITSATTNVPLDRLVSKITNIKEAFNSDNETWQRIALINGWNTWDLGVEITDVKKAREEIDIIKQAKKEAKKEADKIRKEEAEKEKRRQGKFDYLTDEEVALKEKKVELVKLNKAEQVNKLMDLGLSSKDIKALKYEEDRVNKIIELTKK